MYNLGSGEMEEDLEKLYHGDQRLQGNIPSVLRIIKKKTIQGWRRAIQWIFFETSDEFYEYPEFSFLAILLRIGFYMCLIPFRYKKQGTDYVVHTNWIQTVLTSFLMKFNESDVRKFVNTYFDVFAIGLQIFCFLALIRNVFIILCDLPIRIYWMLDDGWGTEVFWKIHTVTSHFLFLVWMYIVFIRKSYFVKLLNSFVHHKRMNESSQLHSLRQSNAYFFTVFHMLLAFAIWNSGICLFSFMFNMYIYAFNEPSKTFNRYCEHLYITRMLLNLRKWFNIKLYWYTRCNFMDGNDPLFPLYLILSGIDIIMYHLVRGFYEIFLVFCLIGALIWYSMCTRVVKSVKRLRDFTPFVFVNLKKDAHS